MTDDRFLELAPLAALDVLDGADRAEFEAHAASCPTCRQERAVYEAMLARIPLALEPMPCAAPRELVLEAVTREPRPAARASLAQRRQGALPWLATAAAAVLGILWAATRVERDAARREAEQAGREAAALRAEVGRVRQELAEVRETLGREQAFAALIADPDTRVALLAALAVVPGASGRVVWNPRTRQAVLIASGLPPVPGGKAYEVWVIARGAPVPAGIFQVDAQGRAVHRLPVLDATASARTFAVTVEPAGGAPAPTGSMVLAGAS